MKKRQLLAFELEFSGVPRKEIEAATHYRENTLNAYFAKNGLWRSEYDSWSNEYISEILKDSRVRIIRATTEAIDVLIKCLGMVDENPSIALRASMIVLDYAGFAKSNKCMVEVEKPINIPEEITKWFEENNMKEKYENEKQSIPQTEAIQTI